MQEITFFGLLKDSWNTYMKNFMNLWKIYIFIVIPGMLLTFVDEIMLTINSPEGKIIFAIAVLIAVIFTILVGIALFFQIKNVIEKKNESISKLLEKA